LPEIDMSGPPCFAVSVQSALCIQRCLLARFFRVEVTDMLAAHCPMNETECYQFMATWDLFSSGVKCGWP
jgi:hypothetical protein